MRHKAALFDLDDTLYPYPPCNEAGKEAGFEAFGELGYDIDRARYDELYAAGRRETKRELAGTAASHERFIYYKKALRRQTGTHDATEALTLGEAYWGAYLDAMEPFEGIGALLAELQAAGIDVAIVTNLTTRIQLKKLTRLGLDDHIDLVVTSEEVGREKPSALPFTTALAAFDRRPSEAVVIGDNPTADVGGGNAIGAATVLFDARAAERGVGGSHGGGSTDDSESSDDDDTNDDGDGTIDVTDLPPTERPDHLVRSVDELATVLR
ncbi:HAD family hydrolase [Halorubrum vacuolatum]|uniref:Putative hydrolase of the HAD superfamily n=1 Tax=Halorubrum vacuolatum TaxID=63740 RepID=A0A238V9R7_HALVU|nr:HAD family hydrolase [Halorubrum vacuolatum]SNR30996.1 putative hydrolase of the HAD superfamily [Halorubrum vacuolatum]